MDGGHRWRGRRPMRFALFAFILLTAGCITVNTPDRPGDASSQTASNAPTVAASSSHSQSMQPRPSSTSTSSAPAPQKPPVETGRNWTTEPWSLAKDGWAPVSEARIYPGIQVLSRNGGGCTVNFVFTDPNGTTVYVGTSAHCAAHPAEEQDDPSHAGAWDYCDLLLPPKDNEPIWAVFDYWADEGPGPDIPYGTYVYNSNLWMYANNETDQSACLYNDFAIIEVAPEWRHLVNPSLDHWGGPTAMSPATRPAFGSKAYTAGGTIYRTGTPAQQPVPPVQEVTRPREGYFDDDPIATPNPWITTVDFAGGCLGGDSGSAILDKTGQALAVMEAAIPTGNLCRVTYLEPMLAYMQQHTGLEVVLQLGTEPFVAGVLPGLG